MENKKLGGLFILISVIFLAIIIHFNSLLLKDSLELGCSLSTIECVKIEKSISFSNIAFGFFGFMFGLGFYILFFNKTEKAILKRLEYEKDNKIKDQKFEIILKALDSHEQKVLKEVKDNDGITQNVLRLRTNMSKAKLSYVLQELEKRNLIKRIKKGKTLEIKIKI